MRKLTISVSKNYTDKNTNAVKTKWITVGSLVIQDDGKVFGEIEAIPVGATEFKFNAFERDNNQAQQQPQHNQNYNTPQGYGNGQYQQPPVEYVDANGNPIPQNGYPQR